MANDAQGIKAEQTPSEPVQPAIVGTAAWLFPGLGYWMLGQKSRAITVGVAVISLFVLGLLIGGVRVLEVPTFDHNGQPVAAKIGFIAEVRSKPWSIAQIMTGPIGILGGAASVVASRPSDAMLLEHPNQPYDPRDNPHVALGSDSHARVNEIAVLYTAVAGMLNLLAIIDSAHRAGQLLEGQ